MNNERYIYKITLVNGKEYFIEVDNGNVGEFLKEIYAKKLIQRFKIAYSETEETIDIVAINTSHIISVEYTASIE